MEKIYEEMFNNTNEEVVDGATTYLKTDEILHLHSGIECKVFTITDGRKGKNAKTTIDISILNPEDVRELSVSVETNDGVTIIANDATREISGITISVEGEYELNALLNILRSTYDMLKTQIEDKSSK